ncbi:carbonic anhydrase [Vibrio alginolyticus]|uniref:carbonic anhydrase n=1 Tax=Vibrio TaxID=662 RepID=UPI0006A7E54A|nr:MULTISPECIES: carbonic anhydrase [Vibrio]EJI1384241.1 carbonic anhydrase [Vibrio alginolyticus]MBS9920690.1 carbonic anhydrase [Vibrio alginolyticus]PNP28447.1 carbonic anhydrase [Vibrio alginolyticus]USD77220.1 carbonic anhydrase [Vibrio sp. SCSIO 43009]
MKKSLTTLGLALVFTGTAYAASWGYEGNHGPAHWGEFASECAKGQNQSPINIESATEAKLEKLNFDYEGKAISLLNNGHTLQTGLEGKNTLTIDGKEFTLKQFHFHTPSENHVDGKEYPLEAHFVHADKVGHLAVVAVFFKLGDANPDLAKMLANIPTKDQDVTIKVPFDADAIIPSDKDYYRFNGSLTTPPCSEGVRWFVMKEAQTISPEQIKFFSEVMGKNNRPIQPLNARMVLTQQ